MVEILRSLVNQETSSSTSLYFHLPFCSHKCAYCHFFVLPDKQPLKDQLMRGLRLEWDRIAPLLKGRRLESIYFGGGTPWLMGPANIMVILNWISEAQDFSPATIEITLEANPENVTSKQMEAFALAGINRISIGIQSLDPALLQTLDRQHSAKKAIDAVLIAKECGIENISIDLMYDLPNQTVLAWQNTLQKVNDLPITHLSLYNLTIEPHTVFYKKRESLLPKIPDEGTSLEMYRMAVKELKLAGLLQYEISAFARGGKISRHNTGYWLGRPFLGLGPSAFSDWEGERFQNVANLNKYVHSLERGESPISFHERLDPQARRRELLAIQMRLLEGVDLNTFQHRHGKLEAETLGSFEKLQSDGLLAYHDSLVQLTERGILHYDTVAAEII